MNLAVFDPLNIAGTSHAAFSDDDISMTTLALRTLGTFDFEGSIYIFLDSRFEAKYSSIFISMGKSVSHFV